MKRKSQFMIPLLVCVLVVSLASASVQAEGNPSVSEGKLELVASIPVGEGQGHAKVLLDVEGGTPQGPKSLAVSLDGKI